jgi:serine/threonine protein kinase
MSDTPDTAASSATNGLDGDALPRGYRLFEYEVERALGGGGFGITYLARDVNLDLTVALKEYYPRDLVSRGPGQSVRVRGENSRGQYQWGLERFLDEARALATFNHPNIVRVLRYFRENDSAYIVMAYESGDPLKRWMTQRGRIGQGALLSIIHPLLDGLESVHKAGFLHRDIKPDNIYVRADGSPVLLDFGAARRVSTDRDMTNIVSPGFAPFEQYHSQGNQGPWTDIYSIGAVMYWMTTGRKPLESAARVKSDKLLAASSAADAGIFGAELLRAIDWALTPDETRRPQSLAEFRAAIQGSEKTQVVGSRGTSPTHGAGQPSAPVSGTTDSRRRNVLCTIMFVDLVGYSIRSVDDQVALKHLFNEMIGKSVKGVAESTRITIDTGDGAAICFLGDPEEALRCALLLRDLLGQKFGQQLAARVGLHMGPVRIVQDINARANVLGDGINVAQRVMDFAQGNQVLVSRAYYDVISRIADETAQLFEFIGQHKDKHGRQHELYSVRAAPLNGAAALGSSYTRTLPIQAAAVIPPEACAQIEAELARHIGPLAKVLVAKARDRVQDATQLREALGAAIQEPAARAAFLLGPELSGRTVDSQTLGMSWLLGRSRPATQPASDLPGAPTGPSRGATRPAPASMSLPSASEGARVTSTRQLDIAPEDLLVVETALSKLIGPMARMLVRREVPRSRNFQDFLVAVASHVDQPQQRDAFVASIRRALPGRH